MHQTPTYVDCQRGPFWREYILLVILTAITEHLLRQQPSVKTCNILVSGVNIMKQYEATYDLKRILVDLDETKPRTASQVTITSQERI